MYWSFIWKWERFGVQNKEGRETLLVKNEVYSDILNKNITGKRCLQHNPGVLNIIFSFSSSAVSWSESVFPVPISMPTIMLGPYRDGEKLSTRLYRDLFMRVWDCFKERGMCHSSRMWLLFRRDWDIACTFYDEHLSLSSHRLPPKHG